MLRFNAPPEALDDHHRSAATIGDALTARAAPEEAEHRADGHAAGRAAQVVIPRQEIAQPMRQAQDPLTHRYVGEHMIDQVRGPLGHPTAATHPASAGPLRTSGLRPTRATVET